jgi:hypothetical protein
MATSSSPAAKNNNQANPNGCTEEEKKSVEWEYNHHFWDAADAVIVRQMPKSGKREKWFGKAAGIIARRRTQNLP